MMNCKQATRLMSHRQDRQLTFPERMRLKLHLLICDGCRNYNKHLKIIRQAMKRLSDRQ